MSYKGVSNDQQPHCGGNILEGDPNTFSPKVWQYLIDRFAIESVLDIGSGMGHSSAWFHRSGCRVVAVDGLVENCLKACYPTVFLDLTKSSVLVQVDLVHCQEVVEHIEEQYIDNLLDSLCCGKYIVITHALPGQGGYHHVNEKTSGYWIKHMELRDCHLLDIDTERIRVIANQEGASYLGKTGLVFSNRRRI